MSFVKVIGVIIVTYIVVCQSVPILQDYDKNLFQCPEPVKATLLLYKDTVHENGQFLTILIKDILLPTIGINVPINCIMVRDLDTDESGGSVRVADGGLQQVSLELEFKSQSGGGLNFEYEIYGEAPSSPED